MRGIVTASTWIPHAEHCSCFPGPLWLGLVLTLHWMAQSGLWQASFGGMNSITSEGLNALAQAPCLCAELATALFRKKALGLSGNKILALGQRSVYTHWPSLCSLYGFPFTRRLWKQVLKRFLSASAYAPKRSRWKIGIVLQFYICDFTSKASRTNSLNWRAAVTLTVSVLQISPRKLW